MNVSSSVLQAAPGIQVPELAFPMSSLEISGWELTNPAVSASCNLGCVTCLPSFWVKVLSSTKNRAAGNTMDWTSGSQPSL